MLKIHEIAKVFSDFLKNPQGYSHWIMYKLTQFRFLSCSAIISLDFPSCTCHPISIGIAEIRHIGSIQSEICDKIIPPNLCHGYNILPDLIL